MTNADSSTEIGDLATWVTVTPMTHKLAEACEEFGLVVPRVLLVLATREGPDALLAKMSSLGVHSPNGKKSGTNAIVQAVETSITEFAAAYPDRLLARSGTGEAAPRDENGIRCHLWADLGNDA